MDYHPLTEHFRSLSVSDGEAPAARRAPPAPAGPPLQQQQQQQQQQPEVLNEEGLRQLVAGILSGDVQQQTASVTRIRMATATEAPPIRQLIAAGVVPLLVQLLTADGHPQLQFEAAWTLTNIASGSSDQTKVVVEHGAVPLLIRLLDSPSDEIQEQAVWALGNIAGDSPPFRDFVLQNGIMTPLLQILTDPSKLSLMRNTTWVLSNLCQGTPPYELVRPALPVLAHLIYCQDNEVITDACWALSYLSDGPNDWIQNVIDVGVCRRLVELLTSTSFSVVLPALKTVGHIVSGDNLQTQVMINVSILPALLPLLSSPNAGIVKETCWVVSNITPGTIEQIQAVIDANIIPPLIGLLASLYAEIRFEALWALSNATSCGTADQVRYVVSHGCITSLCRLLSVSNSSEEIEQILQCLDNILKTGPSSSVNSYAAMVAAHSGSLNHLERLKQLDGEVAQLAANLLQRVDASGQVQRQAIVMNLN